MTVEEAIASERDPTGIEPAWLPERDSASHLPVPVTLTIRFVRFARRARCVRCNLRRVLYAVEINNAASTSPRCIACWTGENRAGSTI